MHRVSALLPSWDRSRQSTPPAPSPSPAPSSAPAKPPAALTKVFGWAEKIVPAAASRNSTSTLASAASRTRYGRETYWPTTLDRECDKAARIIKSFCFDGFLSQATDQPGESRRSSTSTEPAEPPYVIKRIPPRIIQNAVGLAVFSCMRSGLWMSGSGGAGLITARKADGTWSPPSAIILHTAELAFVMGVDIYDCVLVINSVHTLELFTRPRLVLGEEVGLTVGPLVAEGSPEPEIQWRSISETVLTYVKARGKHQAVRLDGSLVTERANENERFYCPGVTVLDVLAGNVPKDVPEMRPLYEVIKAAEGRSDYDRALLDWLAQQPAPGDAVIENPRDSLASLAAKQAFGVPDADDPDPFGVIGLEMAGVEIREAGSKLRPSSTQFEYQPSPTSPLYARFSRQSMDTFVSRSNRGSCMSARTQATAVTDACTQTDAASTVDTAYSRANSDDGKDAVGRLPTLAEPDEADDARVDGAAEHQEPRPAEPVQPENKAAEARVPDGPDTKLGPTELAKPTTQEEPPKTAEGDADPERSPERDEDADADDEDDDDEPIICEVATASAQPTRTSLQRPQLTQVIQAKGAIVTIPKRIPPPLPARSPARASRGSRSDFGDVASLRSPVRNSILSLESRPSASPSPSDATPLDEVFATPDPARPATPRHTKNASSVSTAVGETHRSPSPDEADTADPPAQQQKQQQRPAEPTSSADDESEREPITPRTAETDFDTASERHGEGKPREGVRIVSSSSPSPARGGGGGGSGSEAERRGGVVSLA